MSLHADRRAIAIGDDDVVPFGWLGKLVVVVDRERLLGSIDGALGVVDGRDADLVAHVLQMQVLLDQLGGIDLDANRGRLLAADEHLRDAGDLADLLGEDILRGVVHGGDRRDVRGDREDQNRRVGRIDLAICRRPRQILRQIAGRRVDRGLDVIRRRRRYCDRGRTGR